MTKFLRFAALCGLSLCTRAQAATLLTGFSETTFASNLGTPTAMDFAPDGRLFVCQKGGAMRVIKNGQLLPTPFFSLTVNTDGERGLLGLAFHPNFQQNPWFYFYYTVPGTNGSAAHNRVARVRPSATNGDVADMSTLQVLLDLNNLSSATNHNGGAIHFNSAGRLFIAVGENANSSNSQTLSNLLGKILRLNADGSIPETNPFYNTATGPNRAIWALGLRNPYTFAFKPGTDRIFINDVGQDTWEEINEGRAGANYGWPTHEGPSTETGFDSPLYAYGHNVGEAITGGAFYNPSQVQFPTKYVGRYFFSDFTAGWIHAYNTQTKNVVEFASGLGAPVDLKVGPDGALYYADLNGRVGRISYIPTPSAAQTTSHAAF